MRISKRKLSSLIFMQRALSALCLLFLFSCSSPACRQWELQQVDTNVTCFNGGRLILSPSSDYSHLDLEIDRYPSGFRFYINLLFLQALPYEKDSSCTSIEILFEDQEPWVVYPHLMKGGQRLLLPYDVANYLITKLLDDQIFTIKIGRNTIEVIADHFSENYQKLMQVHIEENISVKDEIHYR